ncbi:DUF2149 domain-containing protein [Eggerthellaceae bacterium zg-893]|nr:DUF2149 domain-containing protein [Eggerthellaceae bacterium zg-893]
MRSFRDRRFSSSAPMGEDVNPQAYIVNLADCMLVLACGFLVALVGAYNIQLTSVEELDQAAMAEVDPESLEQGLADGSAGNYYQDVGNVYRDPSTGIYYLYENGEDAEQARADDEAMAQGVAPGGGAGQEGGADSAEAAASDASAQSSEGGAEEVGEADSNAE